jgi:hypothetical protein
MNNKRSRSGVIAGGIAGLALLGAGSAMALIPASNPTPLSANSTVTVPAWSTSATNGHSNPQVFVAEYCYSAGCSNMVTAGQAVPLSVMQTTLAGSGSFLEVAATTALNPFNPNDLSFGFLIGGTAANGVVSVTLPGFGNYATDVQSCNGGIAVDGVAIPCVGTGISAQRDANGNITFSSAPDTAFPTSSWSFNSVPLTNTGAFAIYTDAPMSALIDPTVTVTYSNGLQQQYAGLGLSAPSPSVPEPASLGLLAAGLAGIALASWRRRARVR